MQKQWKLEISWLAGCMVVCGLLGILMGQDCNFDLMNYHFYNGYAFLFRAGAGDIMPAGIHSFFLPWLDVPYYLVFRYLMNYPHVAAFVQSCIYGIYAYILMHICKLCLAPRTTTERYDWLFAWLVGVTGTMGISQIGLSSGEIYSAILLAASVWSVLYGHYTPQRATCYFSWGILLAGMAFALKYTAAPFCVGVGCMVLYFWKLHQQSFRTLCLYVVIGAAVIVALDGWFWYHYTVEFGNPLFPFFNEIFKSPYFDPVNLIDKRFFPRHIWTWFLLPFYWGHTTIEMGAEVEFIDYRWMCAFISFWVLVVYWIVAKCKKRPTQPLINSLLIFSGIGYLIWLRLFVILRYAVVLEGLLGVLIIFALRKLSAKLKVGCMVGLMILFSVATVYPDWGKDAILDKVLVFDDFQDVPDHSLILLQTQGISYVLPFFNPTATFVGGLVVHPSDYPKEDYKVAQRRNQLVKNFYAYNFDEKIQDKINTHQGPIYLLTNYWKYVMYPPALARWGLTGEQKDCHIFNTSWNKYFEYYLLCPVKKIAEPVDAAVKNT